MLQINNNSTTTKVTISIYKIRTKFKTLHNKANTPIMGAMQLKQKFKDFNSSKISNIVKINKINKIKTK